MTTNIATTSRLRAPSNDTFSKIHEHSPCNNSCQDTMSFFSKLSQLLLTKSSSLGANFRDMVIYTCHSERKRRISLKKFIRFFAYYAQNDIVFGAIQQRRYLLAMTFCIMLPITCFAKMPIPTNKGTAFMLADFMEYNSEEDLIYARGNIQIIQDNYFLTANSILYDIKNDLLLAEGDVKIKDDKNQVIYGSTVFLKDRLKTGIIKNFVLKFSDNTLLASKLAERVDLQQAVLYNTCFTPCIVPSNGKPIWQISAQKTYVDMNNQRITYKHLFFEVYKVPVFYTPYFSHPTPQAKAQSGILVPEIKSSTLGIPLYLRAKPNLDFTLTPRFATKYHLLELEVRHKINNGSYIISGSYGKTPYDVIQLGKTTKDRSINRYYVHTSGTFYKNQYHYGFDLKHTSDKAYLKNYYETHVGYLASKLYFNNIQNNNYLSIEGLHLQGLQAADTSSTDPLILPKIRTKNIINLNDQENLNLIINNNISIYQQQNGKQLTRSASELAITNQIITKNGHLFNVNLQTRGDVYFINNTYNNLNSYQTLIRHIPELQILWRYPLVSHFSLNKLSVEPIISTTLGRNFQYHDHKFASIDANKYELSDNNLFFANRYSGIDYHEFGKRISYGVNAALLNNANYLNIFLGQLLHKHNIVSNESTQNVGKLGINIDNVELFYKFRKNKKFGSIIDEVGSHFYGDKINSSLSFIKLTNLKKYYTVDVTEPLTNNIKQAHYNLSYQLTPSWLIGGEIQTNMSSKKLQILYTSIKVTYFLDCVSITGKLYDDYTSDSSRGITKVRSKTVSLGLKILNM